MQLDYIDVICLEQAQAAVDRVDDRLECPCLPFVPAGDVAGLGGQEVIIAAL